MTPAVLELRRVGIDHRIHEYARGADLRDVGREAADALDLPHELVFKTLILDVDGALVVAIAPVDRTVSMKHVAAAFGGKRAALADRRLAERSTGYVLGGISPFGQRRRLPTVLDETALTHPVVYVSAGKRGVEIEIAPADLCRALDAVVAAIATIDRSAGT